MTDERDTSRSSIRTSQNPMLGFPGPTPWTPSPNWVLSMLARYALGAVAGGTFVLLSALALAQPKIVLAITAFVLLLVVWRSCKDRHQDLVHYNTFRPSRWKKCRIDPSKIEPNEWELCEEDNYFYFLEETVAAICKRVMDVFVSSILILMLLPLLILTALLIKLESPGPIFYCQARVGLNNRIFKIIKFRIVQVTRECNQWSQEGIPPMRITHVGRIIRRLQLDELPQLLNVLHGDMSLVGPRPEPPLFSMELNNTIPNYSLCLTVKPGITGWSQINYPYHGSMDDALRKLSYDLYYVKHRSLRFDLRILVITALTILRENQEKVAAGELIRRYGGAAEIEAAKRAEFMRRFKDSEGLRDWDQIGRLIREN